MPNCMDFLMFEEESDSSNSGGEGVQLNTNQAGNTPVRAPAMQAAVTGGRGKIGRPVLHLEKFLGKENLSEWEQEWSCACLINDWTHKHMSLILPTYFTGRAKDFYLTLDGRTRASASRTLEALHKNVDRTAIRHQAKTLAGEKIKKKRRNCGRLFHGA